MVRYLWKILYMVLGGLVGWYVRGPMFNSLLMAYVLLTVCDVGTVENAIKNFGPGWYCKFRRSL